ncbi:MAG: YbaK/EbsC family protein [Clostridia bacterium]|nr:YbaK/EbsC family protein [Clostridia bacterium]
MAIDRAREHLAKYGLDSKIIEFDVSSATVQLAAEAIGCEPCRIAKSLSFLVGETPILVVAAGDAKVDNPKYKAQFSTKAKMMTPEQAIELIGHAVGGVCPFGVNEDVQVYLDESLRRFDCVYPACGSSNSAIPLSLEELEKSSNYIAWVDVCKVSE